MGARLFDGGIWPLVILILVIVLIFGFNKLPDAARSLGRSARILKSEVGEMKKDTTGEAGTTTVTPAQPAPVVEQQPVQYQQPQPGQPTQQPQYPQPGQYQAQPGQYAPQPGQYQPQPEFQGGQYVTGGQPGQAPAGQQQVTYWDAEAGEVRQGDPHRPQA